MQASPTSSVALVTSDQGLAFGTAFLIAAGGHRLMLTCGHVVRDVGIASVHVGGFPAEVVAVGSPHGGPDLALLTASTEWPGEPLKLGGTSPAAGLFTTVGFQPYSDKYVLRTLSGTFGHKSQLLGRAAEDRMAMIELTLGGDIRLQPGFSGAPVIEVASGRVVAVLSHSENQGRRAMAIDIDGADRYNAEELAEFVRHGHRPQVLARSDRPVARVREYILGRELELAVLEKGYAAARAGNGQIVFVLGQAGMGKSALVSSFLAERASGWGLKVQAQAQPLIGSRMAYGLFKDVTESLLGPRSEEGQVPSPVDLAAQSLHSLGVTSLGARTSFAGTSTSRLAARLRQLTDPADRDGWTSADLTQEDVFEYYSKTLTAISDHYPLLISLEDIHWADDSSLLLLASLAKTLAQHPILLICTMRSETAQHNPLIAQVYLELRARGATVIDLDKPRAGIPAWTVDFCREYLLRQYGTYFSDKFLQQLVYLSRGNPFFLVECLNLLTEQGAIQSMPDGGYRLGDGQAALERIPDRLGLLIEGRLSYLDPSGLSVLKSASVEGTEFTGEISAAINDIELTRFMRDVIPRLESTHQLVTDGRRQQTPDGEVLHSYNFSHHLIQRYIYDTLLGRHERQDLHLEVGRMTERLWGAGTGERAGEIAVHYALAEQHREVFRFAMIAIHHYLPQLAWSEVVRYSRLGLQSLQVLKGGSRPYLGATLTDDEIELRIAYGKAERNGGVVTEHIDHIATGLEILAPSLTAVAGRIDQLAGEAYLTAGSLYAVRNVHDEYYGNVYLERAAEIFTLTGDNEKLAEALSLSCYDTNLPSQDAAESQLATRRKVVALAEQIGRPALQAKALLDLALHYLNFDSSEENPLAIAESAAREALDLVQDRNTSAELNAQLILSWIIHHNGRYDRELEQHRWELYRRAQALGQTVLEVDALTDLGHYYAHLVRSPDQAESMMRDALAARQGLGHHAVHDLENLSTFLFRRGAFAEAERLLRMMMETALGSRIQRANAMIAWMHALTGDREVARTMLAEAQPPSRPGSDLTIWALANLELGEIDAATELASRMAADGAISARRGLFHIYRDDATVLADIYRHAGDLVQTARWLETAQRNWQSLTSVTACTELVAYWEHMLVVAKCQLALGDTDAGQRNLGGAALAFAAWGHYLVADANCCLAKLAGQADPEGARALMTRAAAQASGLGLEMVRSHAESWFREHDDGVS